MRLAPLVMVAVMAGAPSHWRRRLTPSALPAPQAVAGRSACAPAAQAAGTPPRQRRTAAITFNRVDDGYLRLDTRTGQVSLCRVRQRSAGPARRCRTSAPRWRSEIARLQDENAALKKRAAGARPAAAGAAAERRSRTGAKTADR